MIHVRLERCKSALESFLDVGVTSALRIPEPASVAARAMRLHQNRQEAPLVTLLPNLRPVDLITRKRSHCASNGIDRMRLISSTSGTIIIECALCFPEPVAKVLPEPADEEPAGDSFLEHWLGYETTGLKDEQLFEGQVLYYSGNRAVILAARGDAKPAPTAATVEAARPVGAGRASTVSKDAIAAADIVRVEPGGTSRAGWSR